MTELNLTPLLPLIETAHKADDIVWKGALHHIGPVTSVTPLHEGLAGITCCGLYQLYIGCIGLITLRMSPIMNTNLNRCLAEQIFAYQFDWRYPSTFGITLTDIDENSDKVAAIRRLVPYFFFDFIEGTNGYFVTSAPLREIGFIVNLTRHLCGSVNKEVVDLWLKRVIDRLKKVAPCHTFDQPILQDYPDRASWESAVRVIHGQPLPIEVLDLRSEPDPVQFASLASRQLSAIDPADNPLLKSPAELIVAGFISQPYRATS